MTLAGIKPSEAEDPSKLDPLLLSNLESHHPSKAKVLQWSKKETFRPETGGEFPPNGKKLKCKTPTIIQ